LRKRFRRRSCFSFGLLRFGRASAVRLRLVALLAATKFRFQVSDSLVALGDLFVTLGNQPPLQ
jgi:hypothetical protein